MKVESIAVCSPSLVTCIERKSVLKTDFGLLFDWVLMTGFTVLAQYIDPFSCSILLSSADFRNNLFRKILSGTLSEFQTV